MRNTTPARVVLIDDHELVARALAPLIDAHEALTFCGHWRAVPAFLSSGREADLVLLDLSLEDASLPAVNVALVREAGLQVLVLSSAENPYLVREAVRAGVEVILRKSAPPECLVEAIAASRNGLSLPTMEWAVTVDTDQALTPLSLTPREQEVLELYASGLGAKAVAAQLGLSENTVDDYLRRIRSAYEAAHRPARTKVDLYRRGMEDGLLPLPHAP